MIKGILLFLNLGTEEVILIGFVVLLLFGGNKLPELARGLGKGLREFKDASDSVKREIHKNINQLTAEEELKKEDELLDAQKKQLRERNSQLSDEEKKIAHANREAILQDAEQLRNKDYSPSNFIEETTENKDNIINK
ncbi:MAG: twin-arginine translocase TatA/TatE family subunit [Sphingobacteriales bacterium]|nr:MAG: twin-arginine translocase TatA/TatE family subunit [Sphingobacteriales bacterium]TAF81246.1 MAG: twin-arginine translocase TatA/TatE family subunit [Sphingobacteriales bacterium]